MSATEELYRLIASAVGADRVLDAKIDAALRIGKPSMELWAWMNFPVWRASHSGIVEVVHTDGTGGATWDSRPFSSSVDAALTLLDHVLPGAFFFLARGVTRKGEPPFAAQIMFGSDVIGEAEHRTLPLAIIAATLAALDAVSKADAGTGAAA